MMSRIGAVSSKNVKVTQSIPGIQTLISVSISLFRLTSAEYTSPTPHHCASVTTVRETQQGPGLLILVGHHLLSQRENATIIAL